MFKLMVTLKRRSGMSREEFIAHDQRHLEFVGSLMPTIADPGLRHRRNYVTIDDPFLATAGEGRAVTEEAPFDLIAELIFDNREQAIAFMKPLSDPEIAFKIKEDEANFVEPGSVKFYVVEEH